MLQSTRSNFGDILWLCHCYYLWTPEEYLGIAQSYCRTPYLLTYKMKYSTVIAATLFGTAIIAAPTSQPSITVSLVNEFTGASGQATVPADGEFRNVADLFNNSPIDENGQILASSASLRRFSGNVFCSFNKTGSVIPLNSSTPSVDLDGNANVALLEPLAMNGFQFQCQV